MKKKLLKWILGSSTAMTILFIIILIPVLMVMDLFGANITTDGYIENNFEYAESYKTVLNRYLKQNMGYVSLERILYFYLADSSLSFDEIYKDNLDKEKKKLSPISEVCSLKKYNVLNVCKEDNISKSKQINEEQSKPFSKPINFNSSFVTSFFMEERIVFNTSDVHPAWDFAAPANTPVYSVCDGIVTLVSFPYSINATNTAGGYGNQIRLRCDVDGKKYDVIYGHLYPHSSKVKQNKSVRKGQLIAGVGTTGYSTGDHLHYEVSIDGKTIDGMSFVSFN